MPRSLGVKFLSHLLVDSRLRGGAKEAVKQLYNRSLLDTNILAEGRPSKSMFVCSDVREMCLLLCRDFKYVSNPQNEGRSSSTVTQTKE